MSASEPSVSAKRAMPAFARKQLMLLLAAIAVILSYAVLTLPKTDTAGKPLRAAEDLAQDNIRIRNFIISTYGSESTNVDQRALVARVGNAILTRSAAKGFRPKITFSLLSEPNAINSFALPTGEVYITTAMVNRMRTEGELAAILANATAHVMGGHHMTLDATAFGSAPAYTLKQESTVDADTIQIMADAGYDPTAILGAFEVLTAAYTAGADTSFFATHPSADDRLTQLQASIKKIYPHGVPEILSK